MKLINQSKMIVKKSAFISIYYEVNNIDEVNEIIKNIKFEHKKATHFPYAYKINNLIKKTDDKEPVGTAGTVILNLINNYSLNNVLLIVIRYYGGTKLGYGGLYRAYLQATKNVLSILENNNNL